MDAYKRSKLPDNNILLKIYGDGKDEEWLLQQITDRQLKDLVFLNPFKPNIYSEIKNAHFLILTSKYEGFPRVLIESLSVGTPVISVDCNSGPKEIISHKKNGLLIENLNPNKLSEAMNTFVFDTETYQECKKNAIMSVNHLKPEYIAEQWYQLLKKFSNS